MPRSRNYLIVLLLNAIALAMVIPALPSTLFQISSSLAESSARYTLIVSVFLLVYIIGSFHVGTILDRRGRRSMLLVTLAANSLGFAFLVLPLGFIQILFARALNGYGQISGNVIQASLADLTSIQERPRIFGWMNLILAIAFIFGSAFAGFAVNLAGGERILYILSLVFSLSNLCFTSYFCPETLRPEFKVPNVQLRDLIGLFNRSRMRLFLLLVFFYICNLGLLVIWPFYANYRFGWGTFESGLSLSLLAVSFAISQALVLPWCLSRFGFKRLVLVSIVSTTLFLLALGFTANGFLFALIPFLNLLGFTGISLVQAHLSTLVPETQQGSLSTLFALLSSIGTFIAMGLFYCVMAWLTASDINGGLFAGAPFYAMALLLPMCCLWKPRALMYSLSLHRDQSFDNIT